MNIYRKSSITNHSKGFTLIELLIVISIIAILVASGIYSWQAAQLKGRDNRRKTDLKAVQQALENYYQVNGKYPSDSSGTITCNLTGVDVSSHAWGTAFTCNDNTYIQKLPTDPTQPSTLNYYYLSSSPYTTYTLSAKFENIKDSEVVINCGTGGRDYCVKNP